MELSALPPSLAGIVRHMAQVLPPDHLRRIGRAVAPLTKWSGASVHSVQGAVSAPVSRRFGAELCAEWQRCAPETPGMILAVALSTAADVKEDLQDLVVVEPVWTGPVTQVVPVRLTSAVLEEVIRSSAVSLLLVSFATYRVAGVFEEMLKAAGRGVRVQMVAESTEDSGGKLTGHELSAYTQVPGLELYAWPLNARPKVGLGVAAMHVKAAIADATQALVTSANVTNSAQTANMELGLLIKGGDLPLRLSRHFAELIAQGVLKRTWPSV